MTLFNTRMIGSFFVLMLFNCAHQKDWRRLEEAEKKQEVKHIENAKGGGLERRDVNTVVNRNLHEELAAHIQTLSRCYLKMAKQLKRKEVELDIKISIVKSGKVRKARVIRSTMKRGRLKRRFERCIVKAMKRITLAKRNYGLTIRYPLRFSME